MSEDMLKELVEKFINDKEFREEAVRDIESAISKHGYKDKLTQEELAAIRKFHSENSNLSPDELNRKLTSANTDKQGSWG